MRQRTRGWIMPEADMLSMLRLIDERVGSPEIDVRHRDALIRLRDILEQDLKSNQIDPSLDELSTSKERERRRRVQASCMIRYNRNRRRSEVC
jgi:hypothetical protein